MVLPISPSWRGRLAKILVRRPRRDKHFVSRHIDAMRHFPPRRIVCLTEETVETLYLLGEQDRIVGVSGYAVRPARVRREKPRVSAFITADVPKILALDPDLVLGFSDLQADIAAMLVRAGVAVHVFNQRDVAGIAGGEDIFPDLRFQKAAKDRIVLPGAVMAAAPDVILASWCGKKVVPEKIRSRPGWHAIPAVRDNRIVEIKSPLILQPGPAALTDGLDAIVKALWPNH
jgi:iron complex transport system substrate-binding protein